MESVIGGQNADIHNQISQVNIPPGPSPSIRHNPTTRSGPHSRLVSVLEDGCNINGLVNAAATHLAALQH